MKFGAHMPAKGGVCNALREGRRVGCDIVQLFVKNNMQWAGKDLDPDTVAQFKTELEQSRFSAVFAHTGYLINLAAAPGENRDRSIRSLIQEVQLATALGLPFTVLHPGSHLGTGESPGIRNVVAGLAEVFRATRASPVRIALENTSGQGSCLGAQIRHLAEIYDGVGSRTRLAVCPDTAHFFEAGYSIDTPRGWIAAMAEVDSAIGLDQIVAFHLNDSKTPLGSHVDRHAGIGEGHIGLEGFRHIVNDSRFAATPGCLETPKSPDLHEDIENLARLRALARRGGKR